MPNLPVPDLGYLLSVVCVSGGALAVLLLALVVGASAVQKASPKPGVHVW